MEAKVEARVKKLVGKAEQDKKVIAVALYGSSLRGKGRDVDICLYLDRKYKNLEMSRKRLEFLSEFSDFDIQIFQQLPIYIRKRVIKEGKILTVKDEDRLYEIAIETMKEFGFYRKLYEMYLENVKNGK